jgi:tetratricopeptide (TPR) repeat protein
VSEAVAEYRKLVEIAPDWAWAHGDLAAALEQGGDLTGAVIEYRRATELAPKDEELRRRLAAEVRLVSLRARLADVLSGASVPASPDETMEFANLCRQPYIRRYAAAARLNAQAFAGDPKLAEDLTNWRRYDAACYAVRAGCGQGADAPPEPDGRASLRGQALDWLRAELVVRAEEACSHKPEDRKTAVDRCSWWLEDSDLAGVRPGGRGIDGSGDERQAWDAFWAKVRATIAVARKPAATAPVPAKP